MGTVYAMTLDDADVCQMLPVRGDQFDQGVSIYFEVVLQIRSCCYGVCGGCADTSRSFVGADYSYGPSMVTR